MTYTISLTPSNIDINVSQSFIILSSTLSHKFTNKHTLNTFKESITINDGEIVVSPEIFREFVSSVDRGIFDDEFIDRNVQKVTDFLYISKYLGLKMLTHKLRQYIIIVLNTSFETADDANTLGYTKSYTNSLRNTLSETYFCWNETDDV